MSAGERSPVPVVAALALTVALATPGAALEVGDPVPAWELHGPDGVSWSSERLSGRVVVLEFWATWCTRCAANMPEVERLVEDYAVRTVQVIAVNILENGDPLAYMERKGNPVDFALEGDELAGRLGVRGTPTVVVIDDRGRLALRLQGAGDARTAALREKLDELVPAVSDELREMYEQDQADRAGGAIDWQTVSRRDEARRLRVRELVEADVLRSADDRYHAAVVLQHGNRPDDFRIAHELCIAALELEPDHDAARWLAAAAKDRHLQSIGEPQIYGTQFRKVDGRWTLDPIDPDAVSDAERARWGVPPLAEARARAARMNAPQ